MNRPSGGPDTDLKGVGRSFHESARDRSVIVEDNVERASTVVVRQIESQVSAHPETWIIRTGQKLSIASEAARIHVARIIDHHHPTLNSRTIRCHRRQAAESRFGISEVNDHYTRDRVRHPHPSQRGRNFAPTISRPESRTTRLPTVG